MMWLERVRTFGSHPSVLVPPRTPFLYTFKVVSLMDTTTWVHVAESKLLVSRYFDVDP